MNRELLMTVCAALAVASGIPPARAESTDAALVSRVLARMPVVDGHNDLPWEIRDRFASNLDAIDLKRNTASLPRPANAREDQPALMTAPLMTDIPRLRSGGVGAQFWSVWIPTDTKDGAAVQLTIEQIDLVKRIAARYPNDFEMAYTAADIVRIEREHRIASLIGIEGGHQINNSLAALRQMYDLGARYMTLTHSVNTAWADSATDTPVHNGLTRFGRAVVVEMNRLGMLVDLSHVLPKTMKDALATTQSPVMFSHSSARGLVDHPRDVPDDMLGMVARNHGIVMVNSHRATSPRNGHDGMPRPLRSH